MKLFGAEDDPGDRHAATVRRTGARGGSSSSSFSALSSPRGRSREGVTTQVDEDDATTGRPIREEDPTRGTRPFALYREEEQDPLQGQQEEWALHADVAWQTSDFLIKRALCREEKKSGCLFNPV